MEKDITKPGDNGKVTREALEETLKHLEKLCDQTREILGLKPPPAPTVAIQMEGGLIQDVKADAPVRVIVADYDNDLPPEEPQVEIDEEGRDCYITEYCSGDVALPGQLTKRWLDDMKRMADKE